MDSSHFDELTKALATTTSRRQVLQRIGGILGGTALAGLFPGLALASNSACAHFCNAVFGANTPAAEQCTSDAAHHTGLCYSCGSNADPSSICCTRNSSGFCTSYSSAHCPCDSSQCLTCDSSTGTCVGCPAGQTCQNGTCVTPPDNFHYTCVCNDNTTIGSCTSIACPGGCHVACADSCHDNGGWSGTCDTCTPGC